MLGDVADFVGRMKRVLPAGWFADGAVAVSSVLSGFGVAWSAIHTLIETIRAQARMSTAGGVFLDMVSTDYFGQGLPRRDGEDDSLFRTRIGLEMFRPRATRGAMLRAMADLTGKPATLFEPGRPADTGGYGVGGVGWNVGGGYGNLGLAYQSFLTVSRPAGGGIAMLAGYGTGGVLGRGNLTSVNTQVSDTDIYNAAQAILPAGYLVWVRIDG